MPKPGPHLSPLSDEDDVFIPQIRLSDLRSLTLIRDALKNLNVEKAKDLSRSCDTAVRERIPKAVYEFLRS